MFFFKFKIQLSSYTSNILLIQKMVRNVSNVYTNYHYHTKYCIKTVNIHIKCFLYLHQIFTLLFFHSDTKLCSISTPNELFHISNIYTISTLISTLLILLLVLRYFKKSEQFPWVCILWYFVTRLQGLHGYIVN